MDTQSKHSRAKRSALWCKLFIWKRGCLSSPLFENKLSGSSWSKHWSLLLGKNFLEQRVKSCSYRLTLVVKLWGYWQLPSLKTQFPELRLRKADYFSDIFMLNEEAWVFSLCILWIVKHGKIEILTIHSYLLNLSHKISYYIKQWVLESSYRFVMLLSFCPFSDFPLLFLFMIAFLDKV